MKKLAKRILCFMIGHSPQVVNPVDWLTYRSDWRPICMRCTKRLKGLPKFWDDAKQHKLYEFTISDSTLTREDLQKIAERFCEDESQLQGWKPGYRIDYVDSGLRNNRQIHYFAVYGEYEV